MALHSPIINVMMGAARKAAQGLLHDFGEVENLQVSVKGPGDFVSTADTRAERVLRDMLGQARPQFGFLMEESGAQGTDCDDRWIVDPLDGTLNFLHGIPHFSISIAHERKGKIIAGLVFDPTRNEMFTAEAGAGAFLNDKRLRVSGRRTLDTAVLATDIPHVDKKRRSEHLGRITIAVASCAGLRLAGSAALDLAYVAAGRCDGFWETGLGPWDVAAGSLIVREAGGMVHTLGRGEHFLKSGNILASNEALHDSLCALLTPTTF